jgi:hypothetical protein
MQHQARFLLVQPFALSFSITHLFTLENLFFSFPLHTTGVCVISVFRLLTSDGWERPIADREG